MYLKLGPTRPANLCEALHSLENIKLIGAESPFHRAHLYYLLVIINVVHRL